MYDHYHGKLHEWNLLGKDVMFCHTCVCYLIINANFCSGCGCWQRNFDLFESNEKDSEEDLIRK